MSCIYIVDLDWFPLWTKSRVSRGRRWTCLHGVGVNVVKLIVFKGSLQEKGAEKIINSSCLFHSYILVCYTVLVTFTVWMSPISQFSAHWYHWYGSAASYSQKVLTFFSAFAWLFFFLIRKKWNYYKYCENMCRLTDIFRLVLLLAFAHSSYLLLMRSQNVTMGKHRVSRMLHSGISYNTVHRVTERVVKI